MNAGNVALDSLRIDGIDVAASDDPRVSSADPLREHLHLFGPKKGCNQEAMRRLHCIYWSTENPSSPALSLAVQ